MNDDYEPGQRYWDLVDPVWDRISIYDGGDEFVRQFALVSPAAGNLFAAHWCQSEVCNGGFHQFFFNSTGVLAPEALAAFREIGLMEWAAILDEAIRFFGSPYPRDRALRQRQLPKAAGRKRAEWDPFSELDDRFFAWLHAEDDRWEKAADAYAVRAGS